MLTIGLTGSIAAGKSTVSAMLRELGAVVIDADTVARQVVEPGTQGCAQVREAFGDAVFFPDGRLNRRALGEVVFADARKREVLNAIIHPLVIDECFKRANEAGRADQNCIVVIDAALLIESGMHAHVNAVVLVTADDDIRLRRIIERDGLTVGQAMARMASQMPQSEKRRFADYCIDNSGSADETRSQVKKLYKRLYALT